MERVPDWGTIPRMLRDQAAKHPDAVVVADANGPLTLAALRERAAAVARGLLALAVCPGDRVAVWAPNTADWVIVAYGIWDAGAIIAPLSTRFKGIEAAAMLRKTGASVLFVADGFMGTSYTGLLAEADHGAVRQVITMPGAVASPLSLPFEDFLTGAGRGLTDADGGRAAGRAAEAGAAEARALAVDPDDPAEIMATSGTTGTPKGVLLHHEQLLRGYWDWAEIVTLGEGDRYPIIAPFSHGFGINAGLIACVLRRATMIPVPLFRPGELMDMIERDRISVLAGAPTMFFKILDELDGRDVSSLRVAICGAAAVPPELVRRLLDRVGLDRMINAYGLMEGTVVSMTRADDPVEVIASTTGRAVPGVSIRIVDDAGKDLPTGERGEILVGGYGVMRGYWEDPERTAETVDTAGWLHTGDIGTLDDRGNLAIVDRKKEMFIANGFNAYPAEIEGLLLRHPDVAQAAVVGVPDPAMGEAGCAFVVPRTGSAVRPESVIAWAWANMSNYKVPRQVILVDTLPTNTNGKVDKPALRQQTGREHTAR